MITPKMSESFGALLRAHRGRAGLSCHELALAVDVEGSYISRLERGERNPPKRAVLFRLADALALTGLARVELCRLAGAWPDVAVVVGVVVEPPHLPYVSQAEATRAPAVDPVAWEATVRRFRGADSGASREVEQSARPGNGGG